MNLFNTRLANGIADW